MPYNQLPSVGKKETSCGGYRDLTLPCYYQHSKALNTEKMLLWDFSPPYLKPSPTTPPLFTGILCIPHVTIFFLPWSGKNCLSSLHPNISIHILCTLLSTFSFLLTRRICLTIKAY